MQCIGLERIDAEACPPLCSVGLSDLVLVLALISFFIVACHTVRVALIPLCQLSSVEDDTRVDQSAVEECSISLSSASCQQLHIVGTMNLRSNDCSKEV